MDYTIVGCGISGLNIGIKLLEKYSTKNVIIYEKSSYIGGRIYTNKPKINGKTIKYEAGAARFNKNHVNVISLLKKYNLDSKIIEIPTKTKVVFTKKITSSYVDNVDELLEKLFKHTFTKHYLQSKVLYDVIIDIYDKQTADFLKHSYPYYSEICITNAYDALRLLKVDLNNNQKFYILNGGLSQLIQKMKQAFVSLGGKIKLNHMLSNLEIINESFHCYFKCDSNTITKTSNNVILACDGLNIQKMRFLKHFKIDSLTQSVKVEPLLRIYAIYNKIWFKDLPKIVSNEKIKYIIPINEKTGLIMISYTDGKNARYWHKMTEKEQKHELTNQLNKIFPDKKISHPKHIFNHYWETGASYWKPTYNSDKLKIKMLKPTKHKLFICGDSFSSRQAWIEGSLESSSKLFDTYFRKL
tara:strand:- start:265 stop:1503 length:1239 start_codon:yes stop_codon:yes gene_type:complete